MEAQAAEALMESKEDALQQMIMKGKRTKRQRPQSPIPFDIISTTCSRVDDHQEDDDEEMHDDNNNKDMIISLQTTTATSECATEEEQDMANCLILLAQGHEFRDGKKISQPKEQTLTNSAYECKTCNRMFPSFQALGGHRASHKKLKINPIIMETDEDSSPPLFINKCTVAPPPLSLLLGHYSKPSPKNNNKSKIHECSICGTEFASGQALGGHMRRHRGLMTGNNNNNNKTGALLIDTNTTLSLSPVALEPDHQENNIKGLCLDLNLPVPEEEPPSASNDDIFHFAAKQAQQDRSAIVYTPPALVDCRY